MLCCCREFGLEPTADTYTVLMCESAAKGNFDGIEKVSDSPITNVTSVILGALGTMRLLKELVM